MTPVLPAYGRSTLAEVVPSVGAHLGLSDCTDGLGLPDASRYVLLLVDGLGWAVTFEASDAAGYLAELAGGHLAHEPGYRAPAGRARDRGLLVPVPGTGHGAERPGMASGP